MAFTVMEEFRKTLQQENKVCIVIKKLHYFLLIILMLFVVLNKFRIIIHDSFVYTFTAKVRHRAH